MGAWRLKKCDAGEFERIGKGLDKLKKAAQAGDIELLFVDETGMSCHPNVQRSWSPLGQAHCADASFSNRRVNVLGALDWQSKQLSYQLHEGSTRRSDFTQFLDTLARNSNQDKWTIAVMDNGATGLRRVFQQPAIQSSCFSTL